MYIDVSSHIALWVGVMSLWRVAMNNLYITTGIGIIVGLLIWSPSRFYILSFMFPFLHRHRWLGRLLGIDYEDDQRWSTTRHVTRLYMSGLFVWLFTKFTGMPVTLSDVTRKALMNLQMKRAKDIDLKPYFNNEDLVTVTTLAQFETWLAKIVLLETNRVFEVFDRETLEIVHGHVELLRSIVKCLMGQPCVGIWLFFQYRHELIQLSCILHSICEEKRLLVIVPQLTIISNFSHMILNPLSHTTIATTFINDKVDLSSLQPHNFLELTSAFFVLVHNGTLTLVDRHKDTTNTPNNLAFGPKGFQCPGNMYTFKFIHSILCVLQTCDIRLTGSIQITQSRFVTIQGKDQLKMRIRISEN